MKTYRLFLPMCFWCGLGIAVDLIGCGGDGDGNGHSVDKCQVVVDRILDCGGTFTDMTRQEAIQACRDNWDNPVAAWECDYECEQFHPDSCQDFFDCAGQC